MAAVGEVKVKITGDATDLRDALHNKWTVRLRYLGGRRPWHAFITHGVMRLGECGSTTYASRTPEAALRKALRTIAKLAPNDHPGRIVIDVRRDEDWQR